MCHSFHQAMTFLFADACSSIVKRAVRTDTQLVYTVVLIAHNITTVIVDCGAVLGTTS